MNTNHTNYELNTRAWMVIFAAAVTVAITVVMTSSAAMRAASAVMAGVIWGS